MVESEVKMKSESTDDEAMTDETVFTTTALKSEAMCKQENGDENSNEDNDDNENKMKADPEETNEDEEGPKEPEKSEEEKMQEEEEEKKRIAELKKKYADWPLRDIKEPHEHDVMYGRGGGTNHHPGNKRYRKLVEDRKLEYVNSKRLDKPLVALEIIRLWRAQLPPGRFLKLDEKTGLWHDVGDKKAREKTSQALREKAPLIRKQQEEEKEEDEEEKEEEAKTTRFAEGTKGDGPANKVKKAVLARDHSLGREYLSSDEAVSLEGFSWQDPFKTGGRSSSLSGKGQQLFAAAYGNLPGQVPAGRNSSSGSLGMAPPYHQTSIGGPPPPPPDYYGRVASGGQRREFSNSSLGSWGAPFPYPPPPPGVDGFHRRSGSWTQPLPPSMPHHPSHHQRSGSWGSGREHSLSFNPLIGASISGPAQRAAFGSGYWGDQVSPTARAVLPPPPPPPGAYGAFPYLSGGSTGGPPLPGPYRQNLSPSNSATPSPPYNVDMNIARSWSGGEVPQTWSGEQPPAPYDGHPRPALGADTSPQRGPAAAYGYAPAPGPGSNVIPRPTMVKRDTSNQNETYETKPSIKRAALNRDQSATSNRLKEQYMPDYFNLEMQTLQETTEQIRLSPGPGQRDHPKPKPMGESGRVSTMDAIASEIMAKPAPLLGDSRVSTIDALDLDFDGSDSVLNLDRTDDRSSLPKPNALGPNNRLTTQEFLDIVSAPLETVDDDGNDEEPLPLNQEQKVANQWVANSNSL